MLNQEVKAFEITPQEQTINFDIQSVQYKNERQRLQIEVQKKDKEKVLHEKDIKDDNGSYSETSLPNNMNPSSNPTATRVGPNSPSSKVIPKPSATNPPNKPMTESDENNLQYLRDVAAGKYDEF